MVNILYFCWTRTNRTVPLSSAGFQPGLEETEVEVEGRAVNARTEKEERIPFPPPPPPLWGSLGERGRRGGVSVSMGVKMRMGRRRTEKDLLPEPRRTGPVPPTAPQVSSPSCYSSGSPPLTNRHQ